MAALSRILIVTMALMALLASGVARADCTSPDGVEGTISFDFTNHVPQYCNGTSWVDFGGGSIGADSLDFDDFVDAMALDASTSITADGTEVLSIVNTGTGNSFLVEDAASTDSTPFVIDASGKVGIGTTGPGAVLHVLDASDNDRQVLLEGRNDLTGFQIRTPGDTLSLSIGDNKADAPALFIQDDGNVGIGTTDPGNLLTLYADNPVLELRDSGASGTIWRIKNGASGNGLLTFTDNDDARVTITNLGNVGIGTTSPNYNLHLHGSTLALTQYTDPDTGTASTDGFIVGIETDETARIWNQENTNMIFATNNTTRMTIEADGDLLMAATKSGVGAGTLCWDGSGGSYWGACTSLRKYKDNIADFSLGLETVLELRPVEFDWSKDKIGAEGHDLGFIAEEVEKVNPLLAEYGGENGALSGVKYNTMTALLAKGIQELKAFVDGLAARVDKLAAEVTGHGKAISELKAANDNLRRELRAANDNHEKEIQALKAALGKR